MYENIVRSLGTIFDNRKLYGPDHKVTTNSLEQSFGILTEILNSENELVLNITPDEISINHKNVELKNPLIVHFAELLHSHEISTLTISKDLSADEFLRFCNLLADTPGNLTNELQSGLFSHIKSHKVTYVELQDDDIVVKKDELDENAQHEKIEKDVMDFLGVDGATGAAQTETSRQSVTDGLQVLIGTPKDLGKIIVKSAGSSLSVDIPTINPLPDETVKELIEKIVDSLERAFDLLKNNHPAKTQKGKKELTKALKALEQEIGEVVKDGILDVEQDELEPIYSAIDAMTDELEIDALAAEYLRKRRLIESSEKRLLKYLERRQDDLDSSELKEKLIGGGLSEHNWDMLLVASGQLTNSTEKVLNLESPEFKQLKTKLIKLTQIFCSIDPHQPASPEQLHEIITQVEEQLEKLIEITERRIKHILDNIIADDSEADSRETESSRKLTRRQLLELIAEIVQELYQPLSVVQCVIQTLLAGEIHLGSKEQRELMDLAARSTQRLNLLIGELYTVVGNPSSMHPVPITT